MAILGVILKGAKVAGKAAVKGGKAVGKAAVKIDKAVGKVSDSNFAKSSIGKLIGSQVGSGSSEPFTTRRARFQQLSNPAEEKRAGSLSIDNGFYGHMKVKGTKQDSSGWSKLK